MDPGITISNINDTHTESKKYMHIQELGSFLASDTYPGLDYYHRFITHIHLSVS